MYQLPDEARDMTLAEQIVYAMGKLQLVNGTGVYVNMSEAHYWRGILQGLEREYMQGEAGKLVEVDKALCERMAQGIERHFASNPDYLLLRSFLAQWLNSLTYGVPKPISMMVRLSAVDYGRWLYVREVLREVGL